MSYAHKTLAVVISKFPVGPLMNSRVDQSLVVSHMTQIISIDAVSKFLAVTDKLEGRVGDCSLTYSESLTLS